MQISKGNTLFNKNIPFSVKNMKKPNLKESYLRVSPLNNMREYIRTKDKIKNRKLLKSLIYMGDVFMSSISRRHSKENKSKFSLGVSEVVELKTSSNK